MTWPTFTAFAEQSRAAEDGFHGLVIRRRKVFQCGEYGPPWDFSLTPDEARAEIARFSPVDVDVQHMPTVFDGKLGKLLTLELAPDGRTLVGDVGTPRWLDRVLGDVPVELSALWHRSTKRLRKLSLVTQGRVPDAVLMSAFAAFEGRRNSATDQQQIQQIHDLAAGLGATCGSASPAMWAGFTVGGGQ